MTGDPTRDNKPDSHHWGGSDEIPEDEYAQHQREQREAEQRGRMDAAHEAAKAERYEDTCGRAMHVDAYAAFKGVTTLCGRPSGHDGDCHPVPLASDKEGGDG